MQCELCKDKIAETFLKKPIGTWIKDKKGKRHLVCKNCQQRLGATLKQEFAKQ